MSHTFAELVNEAQQAPINGWDFSWFKGRATEQRPSWGYSRLLAERLPTVDSALDLQTGGGEMLAGMPAYPRLMVATEGWAPNIAKAAALLHPRGVAVVADDPEPPLPFATESFDLVSSRHPVAVHWEEISRVLRPGGAYLAQHVGPQSVFEVVEYFLDEQPEAVRMARHPDFDVEAAKHVGLEITDLRFEKLRIEFHDIAAVIYFLRLVIWMVPGFTVEAYLPKLREMHELIRAQGPFIAHSTRFLIEARKPA